MNADAERLYSIAQRLTVTSSKEVEREPITGLIRAIHERRVEPGPLIAEAVAIIMDGPLADESKKFPDLLEATQYFDSVAQVYRGMAAHEQGAVHDKLLAMAAMIDRSVTNAVEVGQ